MMFFQVMGKISKILKKIVVTSSLDNSITQIWSYLHEKKGSRNSNVGNNQILSTLQS